VNISRQKPVHFSVSKHLNFALNNLKQNIFLKSNIMQTLIRNVLIYIELAVKSILFFDKYIYEKK